jgi:hypothetical protein
VSDLSQDELTVLLIAAKGEPMIPIGRWKAPTEALIARGYLQPKKHPGDPTGHFNNYITALGMAAVEKADDETMLTMTTLSTSVEHEHRKIRANAEQIAVQMVDLAMASSQVTGDPPLEAMEKWGKVIGQRAMELLR